MSGGRSRRSRECGKAAGVVDGRLRTETILEEGRAWTTYRQRRPANGRQAVSDCSERAVSRNEATAPKRGPLAEFRLPPASGRCGVSPLEWGRARLRLARGERRFPVGILNEYGSMHLDGIASIREVICFFYTNCPAIPQVIRRQRQLRPTFRLRPPPQRRLHLQ